MTWYVLFFVACVPILSVPLGAVEFPAYPSRAANGCRHHSSVSGVVVGIEPLAEPGIQKRYFKVDFSKKGFLPIFVVLENSSGGDLILRRDEIGAYATEDDRSALASAISGRSKGGEHLMLASSLALSLGGELIAMHMMVRATEIRQNIIKRELRSVTFGPNSVCQGFIYIPLPGASAAREALRLRVRVRRAGTDEPIDIDLPVLNP